MRYKLDIHNVDLSSEPAHVMAAIEKANLARTVFLRAEAGAHWLDTHATPEWRLRLMRIFSGNVSSRVQMHYNRDNPLSLVFIDDERFSSPPDETRWVRVAEHFGFKNPPGNLEIQKLGFHEIEHRVDDTIVSKMIDIKLLNKAWENVLGDFYEVGRVGQPQLHSSRVGSRAEVSMDA